MIFGADGYLATPFAPLSGAPEKSAVVLAAAVAHPDRFLVSPRSGDPRVLVARLLTDPDNAAWEVWKGGTLCGILLLDRIVPRVDARLQFVFFDDELVSKVPLLNDFVQRCFAEFQLHRLSFEAPTHMKILTGFVRRKLGFVAESWRLSAYHDGNRWYDLATFAKVAIEPVDA